MVRWVYGLGDVRVDTYYDYILDVLSKRSVAAEGVLAGKLLATRALSPKIARSMKCVKEIFRVRAYVLGCDVSVVSASGVDVPIRIAANPSIMIEGKYAWLYLRLSSLGSHSIPNPWSRTFIGVGRVELEGLKGRVRLRAEPILYPILSVERVEDPRILVSGGSRELYHVRAYEPYREVAGAKSFVITFRSVVSSDGIPKDMEPVRFEDPATGEECIIRDYRDTFPLNESYMVIRPWIEKAGVGAVMIAPREGALVKTGEAVTYPELMPTTYERKTGGNCAVRISSNEYLLIFHGADVLFGTYHTYAAVVSSDGELLGVSPNPVISPRPSDYFGARPSTIFVCGAYIVGRELILAAGKDDEVTLILEADLDEVLEEVRYLRP